MLLDQEEIGRSLARARAAFPRVTAWRHSNEVNDYYGGFSLWGVFVVNLSERITTRFFVTFDAHGTTWRGHLTVGLPAYYWSSTSEKDAPLIHTPPNATLEEAIEALKRRIADLFAGLSA